MSQSAAITSTVVKKDWATLRLSGNQTSNTDSGDHVEFDTIQATDNTDITLSTGAGQANGQIGLKANKTYVLTGNMHVSTSSATFVRFLWYDVTNAGFLDGAGNDGSTVTRTSNQTPQSIAFAVVTPATDITVELRANNTTTVTQYSANFSYVMIEQMEEYVPAISKSSVYFHLVVGAAFAAPSASNPVLYPTDSIAESSGDITMPGAGTFALPQGKRFKLEAYNDYAFTGTSAAPAEFQWRNVTDSINIGGNGTSLPATSSTNASYQPTAIAFIDTSTGAKNVEVRQQVAPNLDMLREDSTQIWIQEIL